MTDVLPVPRSDWHPAAAAERYRALDVIRALALFGVLTINLLSGFRLPLLEHIVHPPLEPGWANHWVEALATGILEFKALTIFSFLFGVGIAIQVDRARSRHVRPR